VEHWLTELALGELVRVAMKMCKDRRNSAIQSRRRGGKLGRVGEAAGECGDDYGEF
jgi:hypothetical protein